MVQQSSRAWCHHPRSIPRRPALGQRSGFRPDKPLCDIDNHVNSPLRLAELQFATGVASTYVITVNPGTLYANYPLIDRWDILVKTP